MCVCVCVCGVHFGVTGFIVYYISGASWDGCVVFMS